MTTVLGQPRSYTTRAEWVFFDVGDVLFNEDPQHLLYFHSLIAAIRRNGINITWDAYLAAIMEAVRKAPSTFLPDSGIAVCGSAEAWHKIHAEGRAVYDAIRKPRPFGVLLDGITAVVEEAKKDFKVGIIANQHPQILDAFEDYGIRSLFDVIIIDEIVGVGKPNPEIFRIALKEANCAAENAIIVGDRTDNDMAPGRIVGLRTLRFRRGMLYAAADPLTPDQVPDLEITDISQLAAGIRALGCAP
jgi:FMN phosphatase YigB (HAD superfamily)